MFDIDTSFTYSKVGNHSSFTIGRKHVEQLTIYRFRTDTAPYLVEVEQYPDNIYILKFYKRAHKNRKDKYNLLTKEGKCSRIIGTCFSIFVDIYKKNSLASFGFVGAFTINAKTGIAVETKDNTKRYKIYTRAMINYFGLETYSYFDDPSQSFYLAVNNGNRDIFKVADRAAMILDDLVV